MSTLPTVSHEHHDRLHAIADRKKREFYAAQRGATLRVLFEERAASGHWVGFSDHYVKVGVESSEDLSNTMGLVEIESIRAPRKGDPTPLLAVGRTSDG